MKIIITLGVIIIIIFGIVAPKFLISKTFSDIYDEKNFSCINNDLKENSKFYITTSSYGYSTKSNYLIVKDYTFFFIKINEREISC